MEWFAKDKEKLVNDIQRMRDNTYFRKASLASSIKFLSGAVTFCIPAEYNGQKSKNGAESCLRDDEAETRAAQGIFSTTNYSGTKLDFRYSFPSYLEFYGIYLQGRKALS